MLNTTNKYQPSPHSLSYFISSIDRQAGKRATTGTTGKCGYSLQFFVYTCTTMIFYYYYLIPAGTANRENTS